MHGLQFQEISEEDVDPEQAAATHPKHLSLSSAQPESVQEDEAGAVPGQIGGRGAGVNKYKQKLVQKFVTQGPSKASNATDRQSAVTFHFKKFQNPPSRKCFNLLPTLDYALFYLCLSSLILNVDVPDCY